MIKTFSLSNWSVSRLLESEPDSFKKARIKITLIILLFSLAKMLIVLPIALSNSQDALAIRVLVLIVVNLVIIKFLLLDKANSRPVAYISLGVGISFIWFNIFSVQQGINIVTMQFIFMLVLSSFYLLNKVYGIVYSVLACAPIMISLLVGNDLSPKSPNVELVSIAFELMVFLNFATIIIAHYIYHNAFSINISEKEVLNRKLVEAVNEANEAAQSRSDFLSTMSHELRTPLNSVIGMTELLAANPFNPEQSENLKILNFSATNLHSLINDILDYNKLGSEKLHLESIDVNLHTLIANACSGLRYLAEQKGLHLVTDIDTSLESKLVISDPTRLTQIINNLVGNAIKFTAEGTVFVELQILSECAEKITLRFSVIDTGIGIDVQQQQAIFEPFTQASSSTTREFGGTGLGLAIVKRLLHLFDSHIHLESDYGAGARFYFDITFLKSSTIHSAELDSSHIESDLSSLRVLVAEDNPMNRMLLQKLFSQWGAQPAFAENGKLLLDQLLRDQYDIILMDIHMPVMDGYETSMKIRQMTDPVISAIPIIALTASVSNNLQHKIKEVGMNHFLHKPFHSKELYQLLVEVNARKKAKLAEADLYNPDSNPAKLY